MAPRNKNGCDRVLLTPGAPLERRTRYTPESRKMGGVHTHHSALGTVPMPAAIETHGKLAMLGSKSAAVPVPRAPTVMSAASDAAAASSTIRPSSRPPVHETLTLEPYDTVWPRKGVKDTSGMKRHSRKLHVCCKSGFKVVHWSSLIATLLLLRQTTERDCVPRPAHRRLHGPHSPTDHEAVSHGCVLQR